MVWGFVAAVISTVLPIWESRAHLIAICKNVVTCKTADASVHGGDFFGDKIGADTSKAGNPYLHEDAAAKLKVEEAIAAEAKL